MTQTSHGDGPPPLPPAPARATAPPRPPRQGLHGCLIALLVAGGLAIPMVAILAAIALPAYKGYLARSVAVAALAETAPLKARVATFLAENGRCPITEDLGFRAAGAPGQAHAGVTFGHTQAGCTMEIVLDDARGGPLHGRRLWLELDAGSGGWHCSADAEDEYLPADCRG